MTSGPLSRNQLMELEAQLGRIPNFSGCFVDPYALPAGAVEHPWSEAQLALYFAWWSFRPMRCVSCGASDMWLPSPDFEYTCFLCGCGAGTTANSHDIVEETKHGEDDDDDHDDAVGAASGGGGGGGGGAVGAPSAAASSAAAATSASAGGLHGSRQQMLRDAGTTGSGGANGGPIGAMDGTSADSASQSVLVVTQIMLATLRRVSRDSLLSVSHYPAILRIAVNIIHLFLLPEMHEESTRIVKAGALFVACNVVTVGGVMFPRFVAACGVDLQWLDIQRMYAQLGVEKFGNDEHYFFAADQEAFATAIQTNVMLLCGEPLIPPKVSWHLQYVDGGYEQVMRLGAAMQKNTKRRLSPEHTAVVVICECIRRFQLAHPDHPGMLAWFERPSMEKYRRYVQLDSTWASAMLTIFAIAFRRPSLELLEMAHTSGIYHGEMYFYQSLAESVCVSRKYVMPLQRRLSCVRSPWQVIYEALHSDDRLVLLSLLCRIKHAHESGLDDQNAQNCVVQILRRHGSCYTYQFTYSIKCDDAAKKHMNGIYVCTSVDRKGAVYTCLKTGRRTITFTGESGTILLNTANHAEERVRTLRVSFMGPMVAQMESSCAKLLLDAVINGINMDQWHESQVRLHALQRVRRRLHASRSHIHTLSNIKEHFSLDGADAAEMTSLTSLSPISAELCAAHVHQLLVLPHAALLQGLTDDSVVKACCHLRALSEQPQLHRELLYPAAAVAEAPQEQHGNGSEAPALAAKCARREAPAGLPSPARSPVMAVAAGSGAPTPLELLPKKAFDLADSRELRSQLKRAFLTLKSSQV